MASSMMQLVERRLELADIDYKVDHMPESAEVNFTREDRRELYRQSAQAEQILKELAEIKATAKENVKSHNEASDAHEKRIRALEDDRLKLRTEVSTAAATSKLWITVISTLAAGAASLLIKLFWH